MINDSRQIKLGAILSYVLIILNTFYGLFIAPYILFQIGDSQYGVYKTVASFSSSLMILDLGLGTTILRYTAKFRAENKEKEVGNFLSMCMIEATVITLVLLVVSIAFYSLIGDIFGKAFSFSELILAKEIFAVLIVNMILTIFDNALTGAIMGCGRFSFSNGTKLFFLLLKIIAIYFGLYLFKSALVLVLISLSLTVLSIVVQTLFILFSLKIKIRLTKWDSSLFKESLGYTALMFVQTLAVQANGNLDNLVVGAFIGATSVAVYSFGLQMFNMYESLASSFSNLILPKVSKQIASGASTSELQTTVTRVGRFQFAILGAALCGFLILGKEFVYLWLGNGFDDVYYLSLIMMLPATFVLIQNACLSILKAKNKMGFRTLSLILTALLNATLTIIGTKLFGYFAAAIGTALSITCGSLIMMNIYYHRKLGFKTFNFYFDVFKGIFPSIFFSAVFVVILDMFLFGNWLYFIIKVISFLILYVFCLLLFGFNKYEKKFIFGRFLKR